MSSEHDWKEVFSDGLIDQNGNQISLDSLKGLTHSINMLHVILTIHLGKLVGLVSDLKNVN